LTIIHVYGKLRSMVALGDKTTIAHYKIKSLKCASEKMCALQNG